MRLRYFAWVRERIGKAEEEVELPPEVVSAGDLLEWLRDRGDGYALALQSPKAIRVAVDHEHADHAALLAGAREVALFPPMTGG